MRSLLWFAQSDATRLIYLCFRYSSLYPTVRTDARHNISAANCEARSSAETWFGRLRFVLDTTAKNVRAFLSDDGSFLSTEADTIKQLVIEYWPANEPVVFIDFRPINRRKTNRKSRTGFWLIPISMTLNDYMYGFFLSSLRRKTDPHYQRQNRYIRGFQPCADHA